MATVLCVLCNIQMNYQDNNIVRLDCDHLFHIGCAEIWIMDPNPDCLICRNPIEINQERELDMNSRPIISAHYYLALFSLSYYWKCKLCSYHRSSLRSIKYFPLLLNIGVLFIIIIISFFVNMQELWVISSILSMLIAFQQTTTVNMNRFHPPIISIKYYFSHYTSSIYLIEHSTLISLTILIIIFYSISIYSIFVIHK